MKKLLKNNRPFLIVMFALLIIIIASSVKSIHEFQQIEERREALIIKCENELDASENQNFVKSCTENILPLKDVKVDFFTMFADIMVVRLGFLNPMAFLFIILPTILFLCKLLRSKHIINSSTRESYKKFIKKYLKKAYRYIWLFPLLAIIVIFICAKNSTFNPTFSIAHKSSIWSNEMLNNPPLFIFLYLFNITLYSFSFVNIALVVVRKHHKFIIALILSCLTYVGIELFLELVINLLICQLLLKIEIGYIFNIMNVFTFGDVLGVPLLLGFSVLVFLISSLAVYYSYRDKEKLIIDCEKNSD